jgi:hypothetical protein
MRYVSNSVTTRKDFINAIIAYVEVYGREIRLNDNQLPEAAFDRVRRGASTRHSEMMGQGYTHFMGSFGLRY